jgi:hypothetical protein
MRAINKCTNCDEGTIATHTALMLEGFIDLCDKCYSD